MDETSKKNQLSNLVLNNETVYEFNNNALASPDSTTANTNSPSNSAAAAAVVSQIKEGKNINCQYFYINFILIKKNSFFLK